jgi:N-carbamoyl-L-amino-acid hydrolase
VANVGNMRFIPGAFNIVPERIDLSLELRAANSSIFDALEIALLEQARYEAQRFKLELKIQPLGKHSPTQMNVSVQEAIRQASADLGFRTISLNSGAGHDAQSMAAVCPSGMLFVPSVNGTSHSAREFTKWQDCVNGANVLLQACMVLSFLLGEQS